MKKTLLLIILSLIFNQTYSQITLLEEAYKKKSKDKLEDFFSYWQDEIQPISDEEYQSLSDVEKDVYDVFYSFYNPLDLQKISEGEKSNSLYKGVKYLIVQNDLVYRVQDKVYFTTEDYELIYKKLVDKYGQMEADSLIYESVYISAGEFEDWDRLELIDNEFIVKDTIRDFRPMNSFDNKRVVYLNPIFKSVLNIYLGSRLKRNDEGFIFYVRFLPYKEINNRKSFLEQKVRILSGHWGPYWQLLTCPEVSSMVFDRKREYVKIFFVNGYRGGEAYLKKENGKWNLLSSKLTWEE